MRRSAVSSIDYRDKTVGPKHKEDSIMSQLLTQFFASVHEFNACKSPGDYQNLKRYYNKDATAYEVDPPNTKHGKGVTAGKDGNQDIVDYLALTQPALWPRFWPTQIKETPTNS